METEKSLAQDEIRELLGAYGEVSVQIAQPEDGSPEIAWGDTFFFVRNESGEVSKMPFATIVIKDYGDFDCASQLSRGGLFRLNIEVGKEKFEALFGFAPRDFELHRSSFDFALVNVLFPHPVYGAHGWASIINPRDDESIRALLEFACQRALARVKT